MLANPPTGQLTRPVPGAVVAPGSNRWMDVTANNLVTTSCVAVLQGLIGGTWREIARVLAIQMLRVSSTGCELCQADR